jgi:hypothetical protein
VAAHAWLIAHGGITGAVVESLIVLAVVGVLVAVWLNERRAAGKSLERLSDEESTAS